MRKPNCAAGGRNLARSFASLTFFLVAVSASLSAQAPPRRPWTGNGFLFGKPTGTIAIRAGYMRPNASGDLFDLTREQFTIGQHAFDAPSLGFDLGFNVSNRLDLGFSVDGTHRSRESEYRGWLDNNNQPITQRTSLTTVALATFLKYNFRDRGRAISNFAWIPARYVPYVGVGAGAINYDFIQTGDFIDFQTNAVNNDELQASNWGAVAQAFSGFSYTLGPRISLLTEARYTLSSVKLNKDYDTLGRIDLSGFSLNVGTSFRF